MLKLARMSVNCSRHLSRRRSESQFGRLPRCRPGLLGLGMSDYLREWVRAGGSKRRPTVPGIGLGVGSSHRCWSVSRKSECRWTVVMSE